MNVSRTIICWLVGTLLLSCNGPENEQSATGDGPRAVNKRTMPYVTDNSGHILFSWFEGKQPKTATRAKDVPESFRKEVRVQDLTVPPEKRNPEIIYLANLTTPGKDGRYPVKAIPRARYEQKRHPKTPSTPDKPVAVQSPPGAATAGAAMAGVLMYSTAHCPVCKKARKWLLQNQIPYKEVDLERDQAAAAQLQQKGAAQGVSTDGVPIFEIGGKLIPGFDPATILRALKSVPPAGAPAPPANSPDPSPGTIRV